jgi:hypothetical protein
MNTLTENASYTDWEISVTEFIIDKTGCDYGDASAIIEAQPFVMAQSWAMGLSSERVAEMKPLIVNRIIIAVVFISVPLILFASYYVSHNAFWIGK